MERKKILLLVGVVAGLIIFTAVFFTVRSAAAHRVETVTLDMSALSPDTQEVIASQVNEFMTLNPLIRVAPVQLHEPSTPADVYFTITEPASGTVSRPWRSVGWRLFARLQTLAGLEGDLKRQLIIPLTAGSLSTRDFLDLLASAQGKGLVPIAGIKTSEAESAWEAYVGNLGTDLQPFVKTYSGIPAALDSMSGGRVLFLFWNDSLSGYLQADLRPRFRGFTFPGSRTGENPFFVGKATWIVISGEPEKLKRKKAQQALLKYLTSPGIARSLGRTLPGEFFYWHPDLQMEELPEVQGAGRVIEVSAIFESR